MLERKSTGCLEVQFGLSDQCTMKQRKQLMCGVVIGAFFGPLVMTCSSDVARRSFRGGGNLMRDAGQLLQDVGQAILTDAGEALVDGGESLQDTGQALSDASGAIGDGSMIRDATAQPAPSGGVCYVAWGDASSHHRELRTGDPACAPIQPRPRASRVDHRRVPRRRRK